jgi:hypothetical protein
MFVQVKASNPGSDGRSRAGRRFTNGVSYRMEVIDDPAGKTLDAKEFAPDMGRISRAGYEAIKADPVFSVHEGGELGGSLSDAALTAARTLIGQLNGKLTDAEIENAALKASVEQLTTENAALKAQLAAVAPGGEAPSAPPLDAVASGALPNLAPAAAAEPDQPAAKPKKK